jgi:hypothetical protein
MELVRRTSWNSPDELASSVALDALHREGELIKQVMLDKMGSVDRRAGGDNLSDAAPNLRESGSGD